MPFPQLQAGEKLKLHAHSHWKVLIPPFAISVVLVAAFIVADVYLGKTTIADGSLSFIAWIPWLGILFTVVIGMLYPFIVRQTTHYAITNKRVLTQSGIIRRDQSTILADGIAGVDYRQDVNDRIFACGSLVVQAAGTSDTTIIFTDIPKIRRAYRIAQQLKDTN